MKQTVFIAENPLELDSWQRHETDDIHALFKSIWPSCFPATARIYRKSVAISNDVTPTDEASALALGSVTDPLYVVVFPAWQQVAVAVLLYAVGWVITELTDKKIPKPREQTFVTGSPNNSLSDRANRARLMERIPDIFGVVRSIPDLIMYTYKVWENHREVEYSWMCVGRGSHAINDIREGDTPFDQIVDASAVVYPPGQLPGGGTPQLIVGDNITEPVYNVYPVRAINGQEMPPINAFYCYGSGLNSPELQQFNKWIDAGFIQVTASTGIIIVPTNGDPDYVRSRIRVGDELQVIWGVLGTGLGPIPDLSAGFAFNAITGDPTPPVGFPAQRGDLEPLTVTNVVTSNNTQVRLFVDIPASLQAEWAKIPGYTPFNDVLTGLPIVQNKNCAICAQNRWLVGYNDALTDPASRGIFIDDPDCAEIWMNFVAPRGLYMEDGANRKTVTVTIEWLIRPCDANGTPTADPVEFGTTTLTGSMIGGETRAVTVKHVRTTPGRCLLIAARVDMRMRQADVEAISSDSPDGVTSFFRTTTFNLSFDLPGDQADEDPFPETAFTGQIIDDLRFNECYSMSQPSPLLGQQVTTIHSRVVANDSATRITERELNCRAFRTTNAWNGTSFTTPSDAQGFVENMLFHVMQDPFIGNRNNAEIDFAGIAAASQAVRDYFGDENASRFSYTFDDHNMSFEETVQTMCRACFLTPYRIGNVIKADPDIATDNSVVLFNHRNTRPGTQQRTRSFGMLNDNDGVEQQYVDPDAGIDSVQPISQFLSQPGVFQPVQSRIVGLRFKQQAWWHAYRQLFRLIHQTTAVEFEALAEAGLVGLNQRILVEDNTRPDVFDGEIIGEDGLIYRTSQPLPPADINETFTVFVQQPDGTVEARACFPSVGDGHSFQIATPFSNPVVTDPNFGVRTTYIMIKDSDRKNKAFLVTEKTAQNRTLYKMQAVNYSHMYYAADALNLWIVPSTEIGGEEMFDRSPYERENLADVTMVGSDPVWGPVYDSTVGFLTNSNIFANIQFGYTKMCWIQMDSAGTNGTILGTATGAGTELFAITSANRVVAGHNGTEHCSGVIPGSVTDWHHYAVSYDAVTGYMFVTVDGEMVDDAFTVPNRVLSALAAFNSDAYGALNGQAKHLKEYSRPFSLAMIREHFQKELLAA